MPKNSKGREHRPLPEKITNLSEDVLDGTIRLPKFQCGRVSRYSISSTRSRTGTRSEASCSGRDPESFWNLVYDLEDERFLHRHDLADPPASQVPLRLLDTPAAYFPRLNDLSLDLQIRAGTLFEGITSYEVATVTLQATPLSEIGRIFERVNTRGTPLATVELVRAATWRPDFDLLDEIDGIRDALARKH